MRQKNSPAPHGAVRVTVIRRPGVRQTKGEKVTISISVRRRPRVDTMATQRHCAEQLMLPLHHFHGEVKQLDLPFNEMESDAQARASKD